MTIANKGARGLSPSTQEDLRRRAVAAVESGRTQTEVAEIFNVSVRSVNRWVNLTRRKGSAALAARHRGQLPEVQKALSKTKQKTLMRTIKVQTPEQAGGEGRLWTRAEVAALVQRRYGIRLSLPTIGKYLKSWGLSPQRPEKRSYNAIR